MQEKANKLQEVTLSDPTRVINPEILLHPNIPKPLHGLSPRSIKGKAWWDMVRRGTYEKRSGHCFACGVHREQAKYHQWLEAHECYTYDYRKGTLTLWMVVALCHSCHNYIHSGRMKNLLEKGEMEQEKFDEILLHGEDLLKKYDLEFDSINPFLAEQDPQNAIITPDWEDWRMVLGNRAYKPIHKDFEAWSKFYEVPPRTKNSDAEMLVNGILADIAEKHGYFDGDF